MTTPRGRSGFVLAFVVLMLFAISVAGAVGYLVVRSEFTMAQSSGQGAEALAVARAGLNRFVAEQIGVVADSVAYALGDGVATVTTRRLLQLDSVNDVYYIRSEGTVADVWAPETPARRVVGALAYHRRRPLAHHAAMVLTTDHARVQNGGLVSGIDHSVATDCAGGGASPITGAVVVRSAAGIGGATLEGSPGFENWVNGYSEIYDSLGLRWDILSDPGFPVDFDGVPPNFGLLPPDSFPVVRYSGYLLATGTHSGRGVLIVDGELDATSGFSWDGIVLAGTVDDIHEGHIRGLLVGGLDGAIADTVVYWEGSVSYYSCYAYAANESLSYLELIENSEWEVS